MKHPTSPSDIHTRIYGMVEFCIRRGCKFPSRASLDRIAEKAGTTSGTLIRHLGIMHDAGVLTIEHIGRRLVIRLPDGRRTS